jgi:hypothetical protein
MRKAVEQVAIVLRSGTGFRMELDGEDRQGAVFESFNGTI